MAAVGATLAVTAGSASAQTAWQGTSGTSWELGTAWTAGVPTTNTVATFAGASASDPVTVELGNAADTVGGMNFSAKTSWTISNGGVAARTLTFDNTSSTTIAVDVAVLTTIDAVIVGDGITKTGASTLTLSQANTYTGETIINAGTISTNNLKDGGTASGIGASGSGTSSLQFNGGTLTYTGAAQSTNRLFTVDAGGATINANGSGAVNFTSAGNLAYGTTNQTRTLNLGGTNTGANTLAATIQNNGSGAVTVNKAGAGTWVMTGTNTYTGGTNVTGGTLQIGEGTAAGKIVGNVVLSSGTTLAFNRVGAADDTFTGTITPATSGGNLSVSGNHKLTFTGANTYTGTTAISSGADVYANNTLGGTGAGAVTVSGSGSTLGGTGTITGATTFQTGTTLDPGNGSAANAVGLLSLGSTLTLNSGSTFRADVRNDDNPTAGTTFDQVVTTANANITGSTLSVVYNNTGGTGIGYTFGTQLVILDAGSITGQFAGRGDGSLVSEIGGLGGFANWYLFYDTGAGNVYLTPTPEPGTVLGIAAAGMGLAGWVRRRRQKKADAEVSTQA